MAAITGDPGVLLLNATMHGKAMGSPTGAIGPIRFAHWVAPEVSPIGENLWALAFQAASLAISIYNAEKQEEISQKQLNIAEGYYDQAKYKWDRWNDNSGKGGSFYELEKSLVSEVDNVPVPKLDCDGAVSRANTVSMASFKAMDPYILSSTRKFRQKISKHELRVLYNRQAITTTDSMNYNLADDRWFRDYKDDQRWNQRSNVLSLGRGMESEVMRYRDAASQIYGQVGRQLNQVSSGLMGALGYVGSRFHVNAPSNFLNSANSAHEQGLVSLVDNNPFNISGAGLGDGIDVNMSGL